MKELFVTLAFFIVAPQVMASSEMASSERFGTYCIRTFMGQSGPHHYYCARKWLSGIGCSYKAIDCDHPITDLGNDHTMCVPLGTCEGWPLPTGCTEMSDNCTALEESLRDE